MKLNVKRLIIVLVVSSGVALLLMVVRNILFDNAVKSLKAEDYETSIHKLTPLAMLGDSDAQWLIGQMYAYGWGVPKDEIKAIEWFRRSAKWMEDGTNKSAVAAYYVGIDYSEGVGAVPKSELEAVKWFVIAGNSGSVEAADKLCKAYSEGLLGLSRDLEKAEYWGNKAKNTRSGAAE
jgi:TPR repeat protein